MGDFSSLGLSDWLVKQCKQLGINKPTPVQENCMPAILQGKTGREYCHIYACNSCRRIANKLWVTVKLVLRMSGRLSLLFTAEVDFLCSSTFAPSLSRCFFPQVGIVWAVPRPAVGKQQRSCCQCCRNSQRTRTASSAWCSLPPGQCRGQMWTSRVSVMPHQTSCNNVFYQDKSQGYFLHVCILF